MHPRHRRFVLEYIIDLNGRAAAIRAGYAEAKAASRAAILLRRPEVAAFLRAELEAREARTRVTGDRVILEYAHIAFADPARIARWTKEGVELMPSDSMAPCDRAAIKRISTGGRKGKHAAFFELHDKLAALEALGRFTGVLMPGAAKAIAAPEDDPAMEERARQARIALRERLLQLARESAEEIANRKLAELRAANNGLLPPGPIEITMEDVRPAETGGEEKKEGEGEG